MSNTNRDIRVLGKLLAFDYGEHGVKQIRGSYEGEYQAARVGLLLGLDGSDHAEEWIG